jgi:hypothetical protein
VPRAHHPVFHSRRELHTMHGTFTHGSRQIGTQDSHTQRHKAEDTALPRSPAGGLTKFAPTGISQTAIADGITLPNLIALRSGLSYA